MHRWLMVSLIAALLAGCADNASTPEEEADSEAAQTLEPVILSFGEGTHLMAETFDGRFEFQENQQFAGEIHELLGTREGTRRAHDISSLIPATGLFSVTVEVSATTQNGDIDAWIEGDSIANTVCDCPFGGEITVTGYGVGRGTVEIGVQYDEISSGPTDTGVAFQGVDYTLDVTVRSIHNVVPAGLPVAIELGPGDVVQISNRTLPILVFDDEEAVTVLEQDEFTAEVAGEYVFVQGEDASLLQFEVTRNGTGPVDYRLLDLAEDEQEQTCQTGTECVISIDAPATVLQVGGCGLAGEATASTQFSLTDPTGETYYAAEDALTVMGWASCVGTSMAAPGQQPGTWTLSLQEAAGDGTEVFSWLVYFVR